MKKKTVVFVCCLSSMVCVAQTEQPVAAAPATKNFKHVAIGINFSPDYGYRTLRYQGQDATASGILNNRNNSETANVGFTTGVNVSYSFKQNLSVEAGVQYSDKNYKTKWNSVSYGSNINTTTGFNTSDPSDPVMVQLVYNYKYIDIPVKVNYFIGKHHLRLVTSAGLITNLFIAEKTAIKNKYSDGNIKNSNGSSTMAGYSSVNLSAMASVGADIALGQRFNLRIEPTYRYGLRNIRSGSEIHEYLWNVGLNTGLYYKF